MFKLILRSLVGPVLGLTVVVFTVAGCATTPQGEVGTIVQVTVEDSEGDPVPTAVIRHPEEADRHRVNTVTGVWEEEVLYLPDGTELIFEPGLLLYLEISAPRYVSQTIQYEVKRRRNRVVVTLEALEIEEAVIDAPMMSFGRDRAIDSAGGGGPSN
tara:strand:+ start:18 stop:488 length:471 start_codon:yes stop_codon:yes gene_type:complete